MTPCVDLSGDKHQHRNHTLNAHAAKTLVVRQTRGSIELKTADEIFIYYLVRWDGKGDNSEMVAMLIPNSNREFLI